MSMTLQEVTIQQSLETLGFFSLFWKRNFRRFLVFLSEGVLRMVSVVSKA